MTNFSRSLDSAKHTSQALSEKGQEVSMSGMSVFGIEILTRYGKARELRELIHFAELVGKAGAAFAVKSAFYDSKSCCCEFELLPNLQHEPELAATLLECAMASISQFVWVDGAVRHGGTYRDVDGNA
ncbi:hypothetical protein D9M68_124230 [compost metagenome]